jgi:hypothetical protein
MFLLFSHKLTDAQVENAQATFGPLEFLYLPEHLQVIWSAVNPEGELPADALDDIVHFVLDESQPDDIVLVQGDFGAVFYLVDACFSAGRIPVYSTTHRRCEEIRNDDGSVSRHTHFPCPVSDATGDTRMPEKTQSQDSNSSNRVYLSFLGAGIYNSCRYALCEPSVRPTLTPAMSRWLKQELFGPFSKFAFC